MNISYTFIGQITLPCRFPCTHYSETEADSNLAFIAEMKDPKEFGKVLWIVTIAEVILFSLVGGIVYVSIHIAHERSGDIQLIRIAQ